MAPILLAGWSQLYVNGSLAGLFVVLESIDDRFVKRWYGDDSVRHRRGL